MTWVHQYFIDFRDVSHVYFNAGFQRATYWVSTIENLVVEVIVCLNQILSYVPRLRADCYILIYLALSEFSVREIVAGVTAWEFETACSCLPFFFCVWVKGYGTTMSPSEDEAVFPKVSEENLNHLDLTCYEFILLKRKNFVEYLFILVIHSIIVLIQKHSFVINCTLAAPWHPEVTVTRAEC